MYHIPEDKRAIKSAKLIVEGLTDCLEKKSLDLISVTDIWKASSVSRATFYRLFDTVDDVITYQCDYFVDRIIDKFPKDCSISFKEATMIICQELRGHEKTLRAIIDLNRYDIIYNALMKRLDELRCLFMTNEVKNELQNSCFERIVCAILPIFFSFWLEYNEDYTDKALMEIFKRAVGNLNDNYQ